MSEAQGFLILLGICLAGVANMWWTFVCYSSLYDKIDAINNPLPKKEEK